MYYTLKTLHNWLNRYFPALANNFQDLEEYCNDADMFNHKCTLNMGYNSLKWFIYTLRDKLSEKELQDAFYLVINEYKDKEKDLYNKIIASKTYQEKKQFFNFVFDANKYEYLFIKKWTVCINTTTDNISAIMFKKGIADIIIFLNDKMGGIIFNEKDTDVLKDFDVDKIHKLLKERQEQWEKIGNNLIICGGKKHPENKTEIKKEELIKILKEGYLN